MPYIGFNPDSQVTQTAANRSQSFTATAGQTTFTVTGGYTPGYIDVYLNGIKQVNGTDVTATNGSTIVFTNSLSAGYTVEVQAYKSIATNASTLPVANISFADGTTLSSAYGSVAVLTFTGDGSTTTFSTSPYIASSVNYLLVHISGVYQRKSTYTWSGTSVVFMSAPPNGTAIEICINYQTNTIGTPSAGTVTPTALSVGGPYWDTNGNTGIGTTSPITKFTVQTTALADSIRWTDNINSTGILSTASGLSTIWSTTALGFGTSGGSYNERMRIDSGGNVGIGTSSPSKKLELGLLGAFRMQTGSVTMDCTPTAGATDSFIWNTSINAIYNWSMAGTSRMTIDSSGNLLFNSGYGSAATAYGCRAWVNFNGAPTLSIRGNGNVTSVTRNGAGDYTVNLTTAMPDTNYAFIGSVRKDNDILDAVVNFNAFASQTKTTSAFRFYVTYRNNNSTGFGTFDSPEVDVAVFR
jgi:hypothetical protein